LGIVDLVDIDKRWIMVMTKATTLYCFLVLVQCAVLQCFLQLPGSNRFLGLPTGRNLGAAPRLASFDPHKALDHIPDTLLKDIDGSGTIRKRFETILRDAQVYYVSKSRCTVLTPFCSERNLCCHRKG
jgi:hypothetical protein